MLSILSPGTCTLPGTKHWKRGLIVRPALVLLSSHPLSASPPLIGMSELGTEGVSQLPRLLNYICLLCCLLLFFTGHSLNTLLSREINH